MIQTTTDNDYLHEHPRQPQQDRYSVVVLDYPRRENQDIECYCIPSSNLEDHGYIPEHGSVGDQRNHVGNLGRPPLSPNKGKRLWSRLRPHARTIRNLGRPMHTRRLNAKGAVSTRPQLTEEEMMKFISSQDDLDWSTGGDDRPTNVNLNRQRMSSIVEPLVQIQYGDGDDIDDTLSAISQDTCWQDDSQGVVELVLPNVLFCDDRDETNERKDVDNWNILFPSYIEECRENGRDEREEAAKSVREDAEIKEQKSEIDELKKIMSEDDASVSSTGWEDTVSESDSDEELANTASAPDVQNEETKPVDTSISLLRDMDSSGKTTEIEEEEVVEVKLNQSPKLPPPDLLMPTLDPKQRDDAKDVRMKTPNPQASSTTKTDSIPSPQKNSQSTKKASHHLKRSTSAPANQRKGLFSCSPVRRSASGPRSRSPSRSRSPRRRFLIRPADKQLHFEVQPMPEASSEKNHAEEVPPNLITEESLSKIAPEPTTSAVKEIDVMSDSSLDSNLTNPSMFSTIQGSPPPSPPKGWMRTQRRGSITKYSLVQSNLELSPITKGSASLISTAGSPMGESQQEDTPINSSANTGLLSGLWRRVLDIPAFLIRRKAKASNNEASVLEGSDAANHGDNADASWRSNSLGSLGGWSAFEDCEEGSSKWWELGSSYLLDQVSCATPKPAISAESIASRNDDAMKSPLDDDESLSSAPAAVFEDAAEDEIEVVSLSPKSNTEQEVKNDYVTTEIKDDPWMAAKRGDIHAIQKWTEDKTYDWSQKDNFGNTALFYACHSGAAVNITIVKLLLDQWPVEQIPHDVLDRCKTNALNRSVVKMLEHPEKADELISFVFRNYLEASKETVDDDESYHLTKWLLYDLAEGDEEEGDY